MRLGISGSILSITLSCVAGCGSDAPFPSDPVYETGNAAVFVIDEPANNGLADPDDDGVGGVTGRARDIGRFKSPSLRNVALTAPYMHDGRFASLEEVVDHYNRGLVDHPNLDRRLRDPNGRPRRLGLNRGDQEALVAFLGTLTDRRVTEDPRWSNPFRGNRNAPALPETPFRYQTILPPHFEADAVVVLDNTPAANPITDPGASLGRVLFYDRLLSRNQSIACASCHRQEQGFSDRRRRSRGFEGGLTGRHSMPLINLRYHARARMFWDERAASIEEQVLMPIQDPVEMGLTLDELERRVAAAPYYPALFSAAFGDPRVSSDRIARALAQFLRSIVSTDSRWDRAMLEATSLEGELPGFSGQENRGKDIFFGLHAPGTGGWCSSCHLPGNPLAEAARRNGRGGGN